MYPINVAVASVNQTPLDWDGNTARLIYAIKQARDVSVDLLLLPELAISGYGCEDYFLAPDTTATAMEQLAKIVDASVGITVAVGLPVAHMGAVYNCVALIDHGKLCGLVPKQHLATSGIHYESRWFKAWPSGVVGEYPETTFFSAVPFGDLVFDMNGVRVGFEICEDAWIGSRPGQSLSQRNVDIIMNPSASHFSMGKNEVRERLVTEGSRAFNAVYLYANLLGNESGQAIYGGESLIATEGRVVEQTEPFSFMNTVIENCVVDIEANRTLRREVGSYTAHADNDGVVRVSSSLRSSLSPTVHMTNNERKQESKYVEFEKAIALGLFDYLRKSFANGYVISLSGGVDSTAVAVLVRLMVRFGVSELGVEHFKGKLQHIQGLDKCTSLNELTKFLLTTVYQATENNSKASKEAASAIAAAISSNHIDWDITQPLTAYTELVEYGIGRDLQWETDDVTLQNLQARSRVPGLWAIANTHKAVLLATSNRSESAVGYTTVDGDTAGGLAPVAGVNKSFLIKWLENKRESGMDVLGVVLDQKPSAELRPSEQEQSDEDDLMPYKVLDEIERNAILRRRSPKDTLAMLSEQFKGEYETSTLAGWVRRFFYLWSVNQWKRERFAPALHVDDENVDPRTWCRFPILSGMSRWDLSGIEEGCSTR